MKAINLRSLDVVFFDRGNVTHECRNGPTDIIRASVIAAAVAESIRQLSNQQIEPDTVNELLISPWFTQMQLRSKNNREIQLDELICAFLQTVHLTCSSTVISSILSTLAASYLQWDQVNPETQPLFHKLHSLGKRIGIIANTVLPDRFYIDGYTSSNLSLYISSYTMSYSTNCRKPDPSIYRMACNSLHVDPVRSAFVGDKLSVDVACSKAVGAVSIWYQQESSATL
jgi:FMN phosphatase YigB (HAD superfamily)